MCKMQRHKWVQSKDGFTSLPSLAYYIFIKVLEKLKVILFNLQNNPDKLKTN